MTTLADRTIEANRTAQDRLAQRVGQLDEPDLSRPSGASQWSVAQVLSHLGSGAEITMATLRAAQSGTPQEPDAAEAVWARWNAMSPQEQAAGFLRAGEEAVGALEALAGAERASLRVPMGFLPEPADVTLFSGMRLNELVLHAWDVEVAFDPSAALPSDIAEVLLDQQRGPLGFLLGFTSRPEALDGRTAALAVSTTAPATSLGLSLGEQVQLVDLPAEPDGEVHLPAEALLRLLAGRLSPERTPDGVDVTGPVGLADLRRVFPGY